MATDRLRHRNHCPISDLRQGVCVAILSGFFIISGRATELTTPTAATPQPITDIERIQPSRPEQSFRYDWRRNYLDFRSRLLVVFNIDPELVTPRKALQAVLYAGNQTVQWFNHGHQSSFVNGIIPEQVHLSQEPTSFRK